MGMLRKLGLSPYISVPLSRALMPIFFYYGPDRDSDAEVEYCVYATDARGNKIDAGEADSAARAAQREEERQRRRELRQNAGG